MRADSEDPETADLAYRCPTPDAHRRLDDAHAFWHDARDSYMSPSDFRRSLNSLLQALRSVVMLVERQKRKLPEGETELAAWRETAQRAPYFAWVIDARDLIVHEKDLLLHSTASVRYSASFTDTAINRFTVDPRAGTGEILSAALQTMPVNVSSGLLTVSRKWTVNDLPDLELLSVTAEIYSIAMKLVEAFHQDKDGVRCDAEIPDRDCYKGKRFNPPTCTMQRDEATTIVLDVATKGLLGGKTGRWDFDETIGPEALAEMTARYGEPDFIRGDPMESAMKFLQLGANFLRTDGERLPNLGLYRGSTIIENWIPGSSSGIHKIGMMERMAERIRITGADGFLFTSEFWLGFRDVPASVPRGHGNYYDLRPDREEALFVVAAVRAGEATTIYQKFHRNTDGWPVLEERVRQAVGLSHEFAPLIRPWQEERIPAAFRRTKK